MSAAVLFRDILATWPLLYLMFTQGDDARHHRTHVHQSPRDPDVYALVRLDNGQVQGISYVHRVELELLHAQLTAAQQ